VKAQAKGRQRNAKPPSKEGQIPCKYFNFGNGYCRFGDRCHHSHGAKGGKRKEAPAMILSKKDKKIKKDIVAMVVKDLKSKAGQRKPKGENSEDEGDDDLYNLIRGGGNKSSLVIQRLDEKEGFIPTRNARTGKERVIMMISSEESDSSDYIPKRRKIEKEKEVMEVDDTGNSGSASTKQIIKTKEVKRGRKETRVWKNL
jgi:hypothetical protein